MHGQFQFNNQRFKCAENQTDYLQETKQNIEHGMSVYLTEFSLYYSNRMSYKEVEKLLEKVIGQKLITSQTIQNRVIAKAVEISNKWQTEVENNILSDKFPKTKEPQLYHSNSEEILVLTDGIQVKQQKENRNGVELVLSEKKTKRVSTDVWMVQKNNGEFAYLVQGISKNGDEVISATKQVKQLLWNQYSHYKKRLPIVVITDGATKIRSQLNELFQKPVVVILDWYHLQKKVAELMSMIARNKIEKQTHYLAILSFLWQGKTKEVLEYLNTQVQIRNREQFQILLTYITKHQTEIIDYESRQKANKVIGSGRMEKGVDQVIGFRQKRKGTSWRPSGSKALAILKIVELNKLWQSLWFPSCKTC